VSAHEGGSRRRTRRCRARECGGGRRAGGFSLLPYLFVSIRHLATGLKKWSANCYPARARATFREMPRPFKTQVQKIPTAFHLTDEFPEVSEAGENFQFSRTTRSLSYETQDQSAPISETSGAFSLSAGGVSSKTSSKETENGSLFPRSRGATNRRRGVRTPPSHSRALASYARPPRTPFDTPPSRACCQVRGRRAASREHSPRGRTFGSFHSAFFPPALGCSDVGAPRPVPRARLTPHPLATSQRTPCLFTARATPSTRGGP